MCLVILSFFGTVLASYHKHGLSVSHGRWDLICFNYYQPTVCLLSTRENSFSYSPYWHFVNICLLLSYVLKIDSIDHQQLRQLYLSLTAVRPRSYKKATIKTSTIEISYSQGSNYSWLKVTYHHIHGLGLELGLGLCSSLENLLWVKNKYDRK